MTKTTLPDLRAQLRQLIDGAPGADAVMTPTDTLRDCSFWLTLEAAHRAAMTPGTADQLEDGLEQINPEVDWALTELRKHPAAVNERLQALIVSLRRMAYARLLPDAPAIDPADPVAAYVAANTPAGLVRRPGDLLHEAFLYVMGDDHDHGEQAWHETAAHFQQLLAQGAQPAPTDLPMDGSDPADRQLLETAVRALEDFGQDRPLATGGYRQDRLDRMAGALRTSVWLRACMNGSARLTDWATEAKPGEVSVTLDLSGTSDADTALRRGASDLRLQLHLPADASSDSGEFPSAPCGGMNGADWLAKGEGAAAGPSARDQVRAAAGLPDGLTPQQETAWLDASHEPGSPAWAAEVQMRLNIMDSQVTRLVGAVDRAVGLLEREAGMDAPEKLRRLADQLDGRA